MAEQHLPKNEWGPGPWQDEPDTYSWKHAGLQCHIYRHMRVTGSLNGYVAVTADHPWWGKHYNECVATPACDQDDPPDWDAMARDGFPLPSFGSHFREMMAEPRWSCAHRIENLLEVHGGVTYAGPMTFIADAQEEVFDWGFGFDTGHAGDTTPAIDATLRMIYLSKPGGAREWAEHERVMNSGPFGNTYKPLAYVKAETERLAEQLAIAKGLGWQALREPMGDSDADAHNDAPGAVQWG
jgi:hypothetical protein